MVVRQLVPSDVAVCADILHSLPEWFGIEESNRAYVDSLSRMPAFVEEIDSHVVGFIALERHSDRSVEIHVMAVRRDMHRVGVGRRLVEQALEWCAQRDVRWLHVKTRGPSTPDPFYERTRAFYVAIGFDALFESAAIRGPDNAALVLVRPVALPL